MRDLYQQGTCKTGRWNKVFKNGPSKNLWKTAFKKNWRVIWYAEADHITSNFLKALFHKINLVRSGRLCPNKCIIHRMRNCISVSKTTTRICQITWDNFLIYIRTKFGLFSKCTYLAYEAKHSKMNQVKFVEDSL